jgi:hypothetical protein
MDKYIGDIINDQRFDTRNGDVQAISDDEMLRYNQYAQDRIYGLISLDYNWIFEKQALISTETEKKSYDINDNLAFGTRLTSVEFRNSPTAKFRPIQPTPDRYSENQSSLDEPVYYRRRHGSIILEPAPSNGNGTLRVTYERGLDRLALREARVLSTVGADGVDLTHASFGSPSATTEAKFTTGLLVCFSDLNGHPIAYNCEVASYNASTDVLTFADTLDSYLVEGYTSTDLVDSFLTIGRYTTTHSPLPNEAEGFFIEWVNRKLHNIESSDQFEATNLLLKEIKDTIVAAFKRPDKDRKAFPVHDWKILLPRYN